MPLLIQMVQGRSRPVVVCDHCRKVIEDARDGNAMWVWKSEEGAFSTMAYTHKACCHDFEQQSKEHWAASDLDVSMLYLSNNLAMDDKAWANAEAKARALAQF